MARKGSEFGGQPGLIQPLPHELTAAERARLQRAVDPDPEWVTLPPKLNTEEDMRIAEAGKRGVGPVDTAGEL